MGITDLSLANCTEPLYGRHPTRRSASPPKRFRLYLKPIRGWLAPAGKSPSRLDLARYLNKPDCSYHELPTAMHHNSHNLEASLHASIILASVSVSCPVLSRIEPQIPLFVCPSVNSFKFQSCGHTPPGTRLSCFREEQGASNRRSHFTP